MRKAFLVLFTLFVSTAISAAGAGSSPRMAFGYFVNASPDASYEYLEIILRRTISRTLGVMFGIPVQNPEQLNKKLLKDAIVIQREYLDHELPGLAQKLDTDIFIYGSFKPGGGTLMTLTVNCYHRGSGMLFSFSLTEKIAADMSGLIDKAVYMLANYMNDNNKIFTGAPLPDKSRIALCTNLTGGEMNRLYARFMTKGYRILHFQGNTLHQAAEGEMRDSFIEITTKNTAYRKIQNEQNSSHLSGSLSAVEYLELVQKIKKGRDDRFSDSSSDAFDRLQKSFGGKIDALIIMIFDREKKSARLRCIDIRNNAVTRIRSKITGDTIEEIAGNAINELTSKPAAEKK